MQRRDFLFALIPALAILAGCDTVGSMASSTATKSLTGYLASSLGVTEAQAGAGVGSVLTYAKDKLSTTDFSALTKSLPGAESYMKTASDKLGTTKIADPAGLNSALTKLGMTSDQAGKFVPAVGDYLSKQGGDYAKNLLLGTLR